MWTNGNNKTVPTRMTLSKQRLSGCHFFVTATVDYITVSLNSKLIHQFSRTRRNYLRLRRQEEYHGYWYLDRAKCTMAFSSLCEYFGRMFDHSFPACAYLFIYFSFLEEISSYTLISLFVPGSVHSGSASWDDWCMVEVFILSLSGSCLAFG